MTLTHFIVYSLAVWRISSLFVNEAGPLGLFKEIRQWAGIWHDDGGIPTIIPDNFLAQVLSCVWCASLYVGLFFAVFAFLAPTLSLQISTIFAFSAFSILVDTYIGKKNYERK